MDELALSINASRIEELEAELEELREREQALVREHHAAIHDQVGRILADHPSACARFHFRFDVRPPVEGTLQGNGTLACWIEPTAGRFVGLTSSREGGVRISYIAVDHVEPC